MFSGLDAFVGDLARSINVLKISSLKQEILGLNIVKFSGNAEVLIDKKMHICAEEIEIDKNKKTLIALSKTLNVSSENGYVKIEDNDFLILSKKFFLNLDDKSGVAYDIKLHLDEGFVSAKKAERIDGRDWLLDDVLFTPCDKVPPHWSISAKSAELHGNYLLKIKGLSFKLGTFPVFAWPYLAMPIQGHSKSGFLLPKLVFDDDLGFGIKEEFYWFIAPHCDSTIGIDWRDKKGIVFSDEFRWARGEDSSTTVNSYYVVDKDVFLQKKDKVVKGKVKRYWVQGEDFFTVEESFFNQPVNSLLGVDFGTDKRIGFVFLNETDGVDDTFYNFWILRSANLKNIFQFSLLGSKNWRKKFSYTSVNEIKKIIGGDAFEIQKYNDIGPFSSKKELEDRFELLHLPKFELDTTYSQFFNLFKYKQSAFVDWVSSRQKQVEKYYFNSQIVETKELLPFLKGDTFRFFYKTDLSKTIRIEDQLFKFTFSPSFQFRSSVMDGSGGRSKFVPEARVDWHLPEGVIQNSPGSYIHYFQPSFNWKFTPKFYHSNWYCMDRYDRYYAENMLTFNLRNNLYIDDLQLDLDLSQGFDFYNKDDIFYLKRVPGQNHLLPFKIDFRIGSETINFLLSQEYGLRKFKLLQSEISFSLLFRDFSCSLGLLYQDKYLQQDRFMINDIPHFLFLNASVALSNHTVVSYSGNFYSKKGSVIFPVEGIKALIHKIYLNYEGHCYSFSLGFEEKNYRQFGNWKSERAFVFALKLDSLGSFAKKFKRPIMNKS